MKMEKSSNSQVSVEEQQSWRAAIPDPMTDHNAMVWKAAAAA